ncbi:MAG: STAS domain-containing protein [Verrucomicrobiota bacterium]
MTSPTPTLMVAVTERAAIVKISGRANFTTSVCFKRLVSELRQRGLAGLVLDLTDCLMMDSTFLGVLAGTAVRFIQVDGTEGLDDSRKDAPETAKLRLVNPNPRILDLLDNLGISDLFRTIRCEPANGAQPLQTPVPDQKPSREELSQTCLEAHRLLMDLNPENIPKFKEVTQFLAEDVKKIAEESKSGTDEARPETEPRVSCA